MQMHDLNNTQLVLLALLVSFVTSIATGIVTVTLLDQAPPAVTQTINRVVERTIEVVAPQKNQPAPVTQTVVVKEEEFITKAAEKNAQNVVEIGHLKKRVKIGGFGKAPTEEFELEIFGIGFALNGKFAVSQNKILNESEGLVIKTADNYLYRVKIAAQDAVSGLMLFHIQEVVESAEGVAVNIEQPIPFIDVSFAQMNKIQIGQTALMLGVQDGVLLSLGVISQIKTKGGIITEGGERTAKEVVSIHTTLDVSKRYAGGPLININGEILGINIANENNEQFTVPIHIIDALMKQYSVNSVKKSNE